MAEFLNSGKVKVFPTAFRKQVNGTSTDPESHLNTELNLTNMPGRVTDRKSFVIDYGPDSGVMHVSISGYWFELDGVKDLRAPGSALWAAIKVEALAAGAESNPVLQNLASSGTAIENLDEVDGKFKGIGFFSEKPAGYADDKILQLFDADGNVPDSSKWKMSSDSICNKYGDAEKAISDSFATGALSATGAASVCTGNSSSFTVGSATKPTFVVDGKSRTVTVQGNSLSDSAFTIKQCGLTLVGNMDTDQIILNPTSKSLVAISHHNGGTFKYTKDGALQLTSSSGDTFNVASDGAGTFSGKVTAKGFAVEGDKFCVDDAGKLTLNGINSNNIAFDPDGNYNNNDILYINCEYGDANLEYAKDGSLTLRSDGEPLFSVTASGSGEFLNDVSASNGEFSGKVSASNGEFSGKVTASSLSASSDKFTVDQNGAVTGVSFNATSDKRLKENITPYECEKSILDLPVYEYDFIDGRKNQIGCLAQDLQTICPEIVDEDDRGYLSIQESKIVYLLLEEVKKLREEINILKEGK